MHETLSDDALLQLLSTEEDRLSRAAVDEILRRGERLTPALLGLVDDRRQWEHSSAPIHATFLLARLQPPGVLAPLLGAVRTAFELGETFVQDYTDLILAACGPDALETLISLARNRSEPFELRIAVNEAVARIGLAHVVAKATAREHLLGVARNEGEGFELRNLAAHAFVEFATPADRAIIRALEEEDLVDKEVVELAVAGRYPSHYGLKLDLMELYDPDAIRVRQELQAEEEEAMADVDLPDDPSLRALSTLDEPEGPPAPLVNASPKVGRNDPCPCGSGRKYKKCCG